MVSSALGSAVKLIIGKAESMLPLRTQEFRKGLGIVNMKVCVNENLFDLPCILTTKSSSVSSFFFFFDLKTTPSSENPRPMSLCEADDLRETGEI